MRRQLFGQAVIFWTPTGLEVPAITSDPSVSARRLPPMTVGLHGLAERLHPVRSRLIRRNPPHCCVLQVIHDSSL